jgi:hypothetical protein
VTVSSTAAVTGVKGSTFTYQVARPGSTASLGQVLSDAVTSPDLPAPHSTSSVAVASSAAAPAAIIDRHQPTLPAPTCRGRIFTRQA